MRDAFKPLLQRIREGAATAEEARDSIALMLEQFDAPNLPKDRRARIPAYYNDIAVALNSYAVRALIGGKADDELLDWRSLADFHKGGAVRQGHMVQAGRLGLTTLTFNMALRLAHKPAETHDRFARAGKRFVSGFLSRDLKGADDQITILRYRTVAALVRRQCNYLNRQDRALVASLANQARLLGSHEPQGMLEAIGDQIDQVTAFEANMYLNRDQQPAALEYLTSIRPLPKGMQRPAPIRNDLAEKLEEQAAIPRRSSYTMVDGVPHLPRKYRGHPRKRQGSLNL